MNVIILPAVLSSHVCAAVLQDKGGSQLSDGYGFSWATSHFAHSRTQPLTFSPQPLTILSPWVHCSPVAALEAAAAAALPRDWEVAGPLGAVEQCQCYQHQPAPGNYRNILQMQLKRYFPNRYTLMSLGASWEASRCLNVRRFMTVIKLNWKKSVTYYIITAATLVVVSLAVYRVLECVDNVIRIVQ